MDIKNLPKGWTKHYSNGQKKHYYHNSKTGRSVWTLEQIEEIKLEPKPEPEELENEEDKKTKEERLVKERTELLKKQLNEVY
mgnify:CR=1 FL=1